MINKKIIWIGLAVIVVVLLIVGGVYFLINKETVDYSVWTPYCDTVDETDKDQYAVCYEYWEKNPNIETDQTAGWKTYTNTEYGFEFKYPENVVLSIDDTTDGTRFIWASGLSIPEEFSQNNRGVRGITISLFGEDLCDYSINEDEKIRLINGIKFGLSNYSDTQPEGGAKVNNYSYSTLKNNICYEISLNYVQDNLGFGIENSESTQNYEKFLVLFTKIVETFKFTK